jgi:glutaredoxin-like YruB-family protein
MTVKVYSTPTCPYCKLAKDYLKEKNIAFEDIDVAANSEAAQEMVKKSGQMGVPVLEINGQIIVGWNKTAIEEALAAKSSKVAA